MDESVKEKNMREALKLARQMVLWPSMLAAFCPWISYCVLSKLGRIESTGEAGIQWFVGFFLVGFFASWGVWSFQVPKWRLLAYEMVDDIEELKRRAVAGSIVWKDSSIFTKTEIASSDLWERIQKIEEVKARRQ